MVTPGMVGVNTGGEGCFGFATFVFDLANSSLICCPMSGSNLTPESFLRASSAS